MSLVVVSNVSARSSSFLGLTTFASKSRAVALMTSTSSSQRASVFLVPRCSCVIASTWPEISYASSQARLGQGSVVFVSSRRVPLSRFSSQYYDLLFERECTAVPFRFSCLVQHDCSILRPISFRASPVSPHSLSASSSSALTAKSSAYEMKPITARSEFVRSIKSCILLQKVTLKVALLSVLPCHTPFRDAVVELALLSASISLLYHSNRTISHKL